MVKGISAKLVLFMNVTVGGTTAVRLGMGARDRISTEKKEKMEARRRLNRFEVYIVSHGEYSVGTGVRENPKPHT